MDKGRRKPQLALDPAKTLAFADAMQCASQPSRHPWDPKTREAIVLEDAEWRQWAYGFAARLERAVGDLWGVFDSPHAGRGVLRLEARRCAAAIIGISYALAWSRPGSFNSSLPPAKAILLLEKTWQADGQLRYGAGNYCGVARQMEAWSNEEPFVIGGPRFFHARECSGWGDDNLRKFHELMHQLPQPVSRRASLALYERTAPHIFDTTGNN